MMEKRKNRRVPLYGYSVEISDGFDFYKGAVTDISMSGVKMTDLPSRLNGQAAWLMVVVSGAAVSHRMFIKPKWTMLEMAGRIIGGSIVDPSPDWAEFVRTCTTETN